MRPRHRTMPRKTSPCRDATHSQRIGLRSHGTCQGTIEITRILPAPNIRRHEDNSPGSSDGLGPKVLSTFVDVNIFMNNVVINL